MQNWRPLKIGGPRWLPSLPNGRTGPVGCTTSPISYTSHSELVQSSSVIGLGLISHESLHNFSLSANIAISALILKFVGYRFIYGNSIVLSKLYSYKSFI